jgi:parallel beta-helix repeat protein
MLLIFLFPISATGATYLATTAGEIQYYTDLLVAGDTLLVQPGEYDFNWYISSRGGTPSDWIVIAGLGGAHIRGLYYNNVVNVYDCAYIVFTNFEITTSNTGYGIDGIKFHSECNYFLIEDCDIHDITGVGIAATTDDIGYLTIRNCHIHDIGGVGEGIYLGDHSGGTTAHHCLIEQNWIHDTHPSKGMQIKRNSYLNVIQDNVFYNNDEAGIVLYKTDRPTADDNNIVRRNVVWNAFEGIFAIGQANIENNVVFNCPYGITCRNYGGWGMEDLFIRNNTVYDCETTCLWLSDWNTATGQMVCVNNACYQESLFESAIQAPHGIGPGIVEYNRHWGTSQVTGSTLGNSPDLDFINPCIVPGEVDLYPRDGSTLLDSGTSSYGVPEDDFNFSARPANGYWDVGAYEWWQSGNPGWQIQTGFKDTTSVLDLTAQLDGDQVFLQWSLWPGTDSMWVFRDTTSLFEPDTVGYSNRVAVLPGDSTDYRDSFGVGDPSVNAFYRVMAWSLTKGELKRSEVVGEFDRDTVRE